MLIFRQVQLNKEYVEEKTGPTSPSFLKGPCEFKVAKFEAGRRGLGLGFGESPLVKVITISTSLLLPLHFIHGGVYEPAWTPSRF
jgi:hypothetical protein